MSNNVPSTDRASTAASAPQPTASAASGNLAGRKVTHFKESSVSRRMREVFGVFQSLWYALKGVFVKPGTKHTAREIGVTYFPTVSKLQGGALGPSLMSDAAIQEVLITKGLNPKPLEEENFSTSFLFGYGGLESVKETLRTFLAPSSAEAAAAASAASASAAEKKAPDPNLLAIPVVIRGTFPAYRNHIMTVVVDKANKRIEFYDPKGLSIEDRAKDKLLDGETTVKGLMEALVEECSENGEEWTVVENTDRHQKDAHNCGIYVVDYIERRLLKGVSFEDIAKSPLTFEQANKSKREELIANVKVMADAARDRFAVGVNGYSF